MISLNLYGAINHRADYHSCTSEQLRKFINDRTKKRLRNDFSKDMLIGYLLHLDDTPPPFRFLELPAELRLHVYRELL